MSEQDERGETQPESYQPFGFAWQFEDVVALATAANEAAGVPDPEPDPETTCRGCGGTGTFSTPGQGGWLTGPCLVCSDPTGADS